MARRSPPAWNGAIFSGRNSTPNARPQWARACCKTFSPFGCRMSDGNPAMRLIPAIDLKDGRCVRLLRGDFDAETRYGADPRALLAKYHGFGADWLHVVDLDGARDGNSRNREIIVELAMQTAVMLQVGGGLRDSGAVSEILNAGVGRAVIGSVAVTGIDLVR